MCSPRVWYIVGSSPSQIKPKTEIGICCFSTKHTALRSKYTEWLTQNEDNNVLVERHVYPWIVVSVS
jgi:hypothetical protein